MKAIKRGLYIALFIMSLFIINVNVKAFDLFEYNGITYTEKELLDDFSQIDGFDKEINTNFHCRLSFGTWYCYSFTDEQVNNFYYSSDKYVKTSISGGDCNYYYLQYSSFGFTSSIKSCINSFFLDISDTIYSNYNFHLLTDEENEKINVLNFNFDEVEEKEELEVTIKGTEILNFILDKTKNIYEVLMNNQIFQLCLGVLLSYLIFMVICRVIKK